MTGVDASNVDDRNNHETRPYNPHRPAAGALAAWAAPERPNVLVIRTDQQHAGMLGCAGNRWLKTLAMAELKQLNR